MRTHNGQGRGTTVRLEEGVYDNTPNNVSSNSGHLMYALSIETYSKDSLHLTNMVESYWQRRYLINWGLFSLASSTQRGTASVRRFRYETHGIKSTKYAKSSELWRYNIC